VSLRGTILVGGAVVLAYLALVLATDEPPLGEPGRRVVSSHPFALEDVYDRGAYEQRGRWLPSGGTPYVDEFSEYPQLATWLMALPYLFFAHGVERGEPFGSVHAARAELAAGGVPADLARELVPLPQPGVRVRTRAEQMRALLPYPGLDRQRAEAALAATERAEARRKDEIRRNRKAYGDVHHVLMALWFVALFALAAANLRRLGHAPAWASLLLLPGSLYYGFNRFDLVVTTAVAGALCLQIRARPRAAAAVLGLAIMVKWAPLVLLPLFLSANVRALRDGPSASPWPRALLHGAAIPGALAGLVILAVLGVTFAWRGGGMDAVTAVFEWHRDVRKPNHSSFLSLLSNPRHPEGAAPRGWGWLDRARRDDVERVFKLLQLAPGFLLALLPLRSTRALLLGCLAATLCTIVFSAFFSPQWVLWVTALGLYLAPRHRAILALVVALELAMYLQLPWFWYRLQATGEGGAFWAVTDVRMALLLALLATALVLFLREVRRGPAAELAR
jgi:hypothetical protein